MNGNSHRIGLGHQLDRRFIEDDGSDVMWKDSINSTMLKVRQKIIHFKSGNIMGFLPQIQKLPYKTTSFPLVEKGLNRNHFVNLDRTNQSTVQIVLFRSM